MSNGLLRAAHRVSGLPAMARQVLVVFADEARDARGGRSTLTTAQIAERTGLSRRTIHRAYVILAEAGHITRAIPAPGAHPETLVHPAVGTPAPRADLAGGAATVSAPPCQPVRGLIEYNDSTIDHSPSAGARKREVEGQGSGQKEGAAGAVQVPPVEPVDQVFDAWDVMARAKGLPGPVKRDGERYRTIERRIAAEKLWRVLAGVRAVGDAPYLTARKARHDGQGDVMADFDFVFGVGRLAGNRVFERLLEGSFNGGRAIPAEEPAPASSFAPSITGANGEARAETEDIRRLRGRLRDRIGAAEAAQWIDPLRFEWRAGELLAIAPSAFHAGWVNDHFGEQLRRAVGEPVRVLVREKV